MLTREEKNITEFSKNLNQTFNWFDTCFTQKINETFSEFWNTSIEAKLISISENTNFLTQREEFFVTKIRLNKELSVFIRLSKQLVKNILENYLGKNGKSFNIEKITELEAKILTGFDEFLHKNIAEYIKQAEQLPINNYNYNECNLTFFLKSQNLPLGKLVIKLPVVALEPQKIVLGQDTFTINNFLAQDTTVKLKVGHTKLRLNDLKMLEPDDIVLLENSNSSTMTLIYNEYTKEIRVAPNPAIMIDGDFEQNDLNSKGEIMTDIYNMWDTIQVDIGAEFEKVKLSLGELKQISEGLVVDIGSVYNNKIDLKVENKIVASGELVIINDRYGVRINQVFTEEDIVEQTSINEYPENIEENNEENFALQTEPEENLDFAPSNQQETNEDEEDFDYSDFDIDEEDL